MSSRSGRLVVKCPLCGASYAYSREEADVDGTVRCQNCCGLIEASQLDTVRCPVCFSENVSIQANHMVCADCGFSDAGVEQDWQRIEDFSLDLLPRYLEKWKDCWDKVKGLISAGGYLTIDDRRQINLAGTIVIILLVRSFRYQTAAVIKFETDRSECVFTVLKPRSMMMGIESVTEKFYRSFKMSVAAVNQSRVG